MSTVGKRKYSASERAWAIESGDYAMFRKAAIGSIKENNFDFLHSEEYLSTLNLHDYDVCRCLWRASRARQRRLRNRLKPMLLNGAWFITLTFRDAVLASTTASVRRAYVRRFLKSLCLDYVANKDFGKDFEREHYHAVVSMPFCLDSFALVHDSKGCHSTLSGWDYGYSNWERIGQFNGEDDLRNVAKYLAKLQNHAVKSTASDEIMIFSRSKT